MMQDLRHAVRTLAARAGFVGAVVATLTFGIGANALVFSPIDAIYLKASPYRDTSLLTLRSAASPAVLIEPLRSTLARARPRRVRRMLAAGATCRAGRATRSLAA
jgi:hypothetical protein